jgi:two-component system, chemotaxis family, chemotaxis protein CheY
MLPGTETHFLVIDDSFSTRQSIRNALVNHGYKNISEAENGVEGIGIVNESVSKSPVQFILCDYNMPNINGMQFLDIIKKDPDLRNIPFVLITARSDLKIVTEFIKRGISQFLVKPFDPHSLMERIEMAWEKHKAKST